MLERYRRYLRPELVLLVMVLAGAFGVWFLVRQIGSLPEQEQDLAREIGKTRDAADALATQRLDLERQLAELKASPDPQPFPSQAEATELGTSVSTFVSNKGLALLKFSTARELVALGEDQLPVVSYLVTTRGDAPELIGLIAIVDSTPTAVVRSLDFTRAGEEGGEWELNLSMIVYHAGQ